MVRFARSSAVCMAFVVAVAAGGLSHGQTLLRWKFKPGQVQHLSMTQDSKQKIKVGDQPPMPTDATNTIDLTWKVESVDSQGVATLTQTFDRMRIKMQAAPGVTIDFDSASKKAPEGMATMMATMMKPLVGAQFTARMNARGDVLEIKVPEAVAAMKKSMAAGGMGDMFSAEGIKKMSGIGVLPEKPVKPGESWVNRMEMKLPFVGTLVMEQKYTYLGPVQRAGRELEKVALAIHAKPEAKKDGGPAPVAQLDGQGTLYFDNRAGRIVENESTMTMKMDMNIMGQKANISAETTAKMTASEDKELPKP